MFKTWGIKNDVSARYKRPDWRPLSSTSNLIFNIVLRCIIGSGFIDGPGNGNSQRRSCRQCAVQVGCSVSLSRIGAWPAALLENQMSGPDHFPTRRSLLHYGPLVRYVKLRVAHAPGMPGTFSLPPRVSDPDMNHGTWVTHAPWCMPRLLTSGIFEVGGGENVPGVPGACKTQNCTYLVRGQTKHSSYAIRWIGWSGVCRPYRLVWDIIDHCDGWHSLKLHLHTTHAFHHSVNAATLQELSWDEAGSRYLRYARFHTNIKLSGWQMAEYLGNPTVQFEFIVHHINKPMPQIPHCICPISGTETFHGKHDVPL